LDEIITLLTWASPKWSSEELIRIVGIGNIGIAFVLFAKA